MSLNNYFLNSEMSSKLITNRTLTLYEPLLSLLSFPFIPLISYKHPIHKTGVDSYESGLIALDFQEIYAPIK